MKYLLLLLLPLVSCKKDCISSATCNDERLEFGYKCEVCKNVGIKFYYGCDDDLIKNC